jgi:N-acetyl-gamma-glutamyl-phosphate reductase
MIQVGIIGGAGYTAGELIRLLLHHPKATINFIYSTSIVGNLVSDVHQDLVGQTSIKFTSTLTPDVDVVFLCLGHGNSKLFLEKTPFSKNTKIIDLSNDFRITKEARLQDNTFVYGLPELQKETIKKAQHIANPGCFATAIQLALLPLFSTKAITSNIHIQATTGSTGAGVSLTQTSHFSWRNNNFSYYKPFTHQHLSEINQTLKKITPNWNSELFFIPFRGNFSRGIYATAYTTYKGSIQKAIDTYTNFYKEAAFTFISKGEVHLKQVVNTNNCLIGLHKHNDTLLITSCIDNLLKGASGQAVQNMNIMFGIDETTGLKLKATYF